MGIFRATVGRASGLAALIGALAVGALAGCGGARPEAKPTTPPKTEERTLPLDQVFLLESAGAPTIDTSATLVAGTARWVVLRDAPPDNTVFARIYFARDAFKADTGATVEVTMRARPGVYGIQVGTSAPWAATARLRFSYARFFSAPVAARAKYGSDAAFEQSLAIGRINSGGTITLLPTERPSPDNLEAKVAEPGTYVVAGPR